MMTSLLFVDDQANVLSGIRRMLRSYHKQWDMEFACGGHEALELMQDKRFDVVITDMRMPGIDGAALLGNVREKWPSTIRIVLSGQSDRERILCALGPAHQYLSKPCDAEKLTSTVARCCMLRDRLKNDRLKQLVSQLDTVPSSAHSLEQLTSELNSSSATIDNVAKIVAGDVGMTSKFLQLVSSSFFGQPQRVKSAEQAVSLLGLDLLRELLRIEGVFRVFEEEQFAHFSLNELTNHSRDVAECAYNIAKLESDDPQVHGDSRLAGLLHDVGKLVLATCAADEFRQAVDLAHDQQITLWEAEMHVFGSSHAEVGSYLLGLWGAPLPVMEAICLYRTPEEAESTGFSPLVAVHAANILCRKRVSSRAQEATLLERSEFLANGPFADRVEQWHRATNTSVPKHQAVP
ncbi:HDOD domain-containing protein [Aeoliella mucimassa]|uniref:Hydrogenase transcriptional regulatory protein hupR1 n=1 Tax=Aeoliella mucimassa TaxID=2527972 RepID=A0A518AHL0_9BACT|nr:HDOD domain-containing protein [Aeoliella mucimassa]QDU54164.1 Hydrogenase transcriptional regulatory protein hupR1 [Aeoliella mucimassa]